VVHRALEICLREAQVTARDAVYGAAQEVGLTVHLPEAVQDVARGLGALEQHGLLGLVGESMRLEYPVSGIGEGGLVLLGYVDLVRVDGKVLTVIDFKTDQPPQQDVAAELPGYVAQVQMYARLLTLGGVGDGAVKCGLLFTADGGLRWV
jgi:ATP-dependent helicase/nuclease subunit A